MKQLITDIISRFGGRAPGSDKERQAQLYLKGVLEQFCDKVSVHEFKTPVKAMFHSLKIFCALFYLSLILYWLHPAAAFALSLINTILYVGHFVTYGHWLDFIYKKYDSLTVIGDIEPEGEAHSTVIVSAHMDSTPEFIWWYRLKHPGLVLSVLSGFIIGLYPLTAGLGIIQQQAGFGMPAADYLWWVTAVVSPLTIVLFNIHGKNVIQGAQDNLSGVAIAAAVCRHFAASRLRHTRVRVVSFGCEEPGLRGSDAYAKDFKEQLKKENSVCINIDGVKDADKLTIITAEPMVLARYNDFMIQRLENSFRALSIPYLKKMIPVGATDGVSFVRQGIPAVSIIGQSTVRLDRTYHTRLDTPECVDERALELTRQAVIQFIDTWDKGG